MPSEYRPWQLPDRKYIEGNQISFTRPASISTPARKNHFKQAGQRQRSRKSLPDMWRSIATPCWATIARQTLTGQTCPRCFQRSEYFEPAVTAATIRACTTSPLSGSANQNCHRPPEYFREVLKKMKFAQNLLQAAVTTWLPLHSSTNQRSLAAKNATLSTDTQCALLRFQLLATSLRSLVLFLVCVLVHVLFLVLVLLPFLLQRILMSKSHFEIFTQLNASVRFLAPNH